MWFVLSSPAPTFSYISNVDQGGNSNNNLNDKGSIKAKEPNDTPNSDDSEIELQTEEPIRVRMVILLPHLECV